MISAPKQLSFRSQFDIALLALLNLPGGFGKFWRERHGDEHSATLERGRPDNVVRLAPLEMGVLSAQRRLHREADPSCRPRAQACSDWRLALPFASATHETALQRRDVFPEFFIDGRKISTGKSTSKLVRLRDRLRFRGRILARVIIEQRRHGRRIGAHLLDRLGKPLVDRAVHQPVREPEHGNHGQERQAAG